MDDHDLRDLLFYTIHEDGSATAYAVDRRRDRDCLFRAEIPPSSLGGDIWEHLVASSDGEWMTRTESIGWTESFLEGAKHLPFGCADANTPLGNHWMYREESDITDPVPPLADRIGITEWTVHRDSGSDETFTGDIDLAVGRLADVGMSEALRAINILGDGPSEKGKGPGGSRAWLCRTDRPGVSFTTDCSGLALWEDGKRVGWISFRELHTFKQRKG